MRGGDATAGSTFAGAIRTVLANIAFRPGPMVARRGWAPGGLRGGAGNVNAMSAIFGIVHFDGQPVAESDLNLMSAALAAHGPDGEGVRLDGNVGLGQRLMRFTPED